MRIKELFCIWILLKVCWIYTQSNSSKICFEIKKNLSANCNGESFSLSCGADEVIMINTISYKKGTIASGKIKCIHCYQDDTTISNWDINPVSFKSKLYQFCSQQRQCSIGVGVDIKNPADDKNYLWYADVSYDCLNAALLHDMCMPWETTLLLESLHITMNSSSVDGGYCSCIINGHADILVVDYRPYYNDVGCSDAIFLIDRDQKFKCTTSTSSDKSVYNRQINVNREETNITVLFSTRHPQMVWIRIKEYNRVQCNADQITAAATSTTKTTTGGTVTIPASTHTIHTESSKDSNTPVSAIVGGTVGLVAVVVVVVLIVCFFCKRRTCRIDETKKQQNIYNTVGFEAKGTQKATIMNGVVNKSYEQGGEMIDTASFSASNYQEIDTSNVYSEPADAVADDIYTEPTETDANVQNSQTARDEDMCHNYREPYDKTLLTRDNGNKTYYNEVIKVDEKNDAYSTLCAIDNYSHIHIVPDKQVPNLIDNYSHIKIGQSEDKITKEGSADVYSHLEEDTNQQNVSDNIKYMEKQRNRTGTEKYDHLHVADFLHH